jgi:hypothetical protein
MSLTEFLVTRKGENISADLTNSIFSSMIGGGIIPKTKIDATRTEYKEDRFNYKFTVLDKGHETTVYGNFPTKVLNKLNDYNLVLNKIN